MKRQSISFYFFLIDMASFQERHCEDSLQQKAYPRNAKLLLLYVSTTHAVEHLALRLLFDVVALHA